MYPFRRVFLFPTLLLCLLPAGAWAQGHVVSIYVLKDTGRQYTFKDVLSPAVAARFDSTIADKNTLIDDTKAAYWLRIKVKNPNREKLVLTGHFLYQDLQLYVPDTAGGYQLKRACLDLPFHDREVRYPEPTFELPDAGPGVQTYYVRLTSNLNLGLSCPIIPYRDFWNETLSNYLFYSFILGIILIIGVYNLIIAVILKEKAYWYYCLYVFGFAVFTLVDTGFLKMLYWGDALEWRKNLWTTPFCLMTLSLLLYSRSFLQVQQALPAYYRLITLGAWVRAALFVTGEVFEITLFYEPYIDLGILSVAYVAGLIRYRGGYKPAKYFLLGFTVLYAGYIVHAFHLSYWLYYNQLFYLFVIGWLTLFSVALADRFRVLKAENEAASRRVIGQLRERELLQEELNKQLEEKVADRTREIARINALLEEKNRLLEHTNQELTCTVVDIATARVMHKEVSFEEFRRIYPDEDACLKFLAEQKWGNGFGCRKCGYRRYSAGNVPYARRCKNCRYIETAKAFTLFNNLKFPIVKAFYLVFLLSRGREITAEELSRLLDLRRQTCWAFKKKVKAVMEKRKYFRKPHDDWSHLILETEENEFHSATKAAV